jgi:drug/metabolite transporter (DMT)-like permease
VVKRIALVVLGALAVTLMCATAALASTSAELLDRGGYPHTGTQIAVFAVVVVVLLVGGILLWYYSHPRKRDTEGPSDSRPEDQD